MQLPPWSGHREVAIVERPPWSSHRGAAARPLVTPAAGAHALSIPAFVGSPVRPLQPVFHQRIVGFSYFSAFTLLLPHGDFPLRHRLL